VVFDEFDRITDPNARRLMADAVKTMSDKSSGNTVVLVGVGNDVRDLVGEHPSTERNFRQVAMPRMTPDELREILELGFAELEMTLPEATRDRILDLSHGFPHYTHLLAKYCALEAINRNSRSVSPDDFEVAVDRAIEDTYETIGDAYQRATMITTTTTTNSIFPAVLLAAALAEHDEHHTFRATDMVHPLNEITGQDYAVPNFTYNLRKLSSPERGDILERVGDRRPRFRFRSPLMRPYVLMKGFSDGLIDESQLY